MKARYLSLFSYLGNNFRASEKLWIKGGACYPDPTSVQGLLEFALIKLRSNDYPRVILSSRTDQGVHALCSSCHYDLKSHREEKIYCPNNITFHLNNTFRKNETSIHVLNTYRVPDNFSARFSAKSRRYLYRLAVLKKQLQEKQPPCHLHSLTPIEEWKRCHFIRCPNFDINKFIEGSKYFIGYHDFTTFKKFDTGNPYKQNRREIYNIEVHPGAPLVVSKRELVEYFDYWDIEIHGRSFVHNQIRRMIGTLISVAIGKISPEEIKLMLQIPSKHSWHSFLQVAPSDGLYLKQVEYDPNDLIYREDLSSGARESYSSDDECE